MRLEYSFLITVYSKDNPKFFREALESMLNQTRKPNEIVLVKDGEIGKEIQSVIDGLNKKYGNLIKEIQLKKNLGLGLALNEGIKKCKNELIARMDADDISTLDRCEKEIIEFEKDHELDIIGSPVLEFENNISNVLGIRDVPKSNDEIYLYAKKRDPFNHPTVMYKKSTIEKVGMYSNLRKNQDTDLWIKLIKNGAKCKNLSEPCLYFRFSEDTFKKRKNFENTKLLLKVRWNAYRVGYISYFEFFQIFIIQILIYLLPISFQKIVYKNFLRK